jgi:ABC-type nickel/cobalt efflux system permease component RcnA
MRMQTQFYQKLVAALDAFSGNAHAGVWLMGLSFLYGVFHAVGPGHGKAVIASYLVATGDTRRRAVLLSIAASVLQAVTAIAIVSMAVIVFNTTAAAMAQVTDGIEIFSYALVALLGLALIVSRGRSVLDAWRARRAGRTAFSCDAIPAGVTSADALEPDMMRHGVNCACVEMSRLAVAGPKAISRQMLATVFSMGMRPCSGALIVLVFSLSRHLYPAGMASVFAMAAGTALTVGLVALLSGTARDLLGRLASSDNAGAAVFSASLQFAAAFVIFVFGLTMAAGVLAADGLL